MATKFYSSSQITTLTGGHITPEHLRDWRRRKMLDKLGTLQPDGKNWGYRIGDVICFAITAELQKQGIWVTQALETASHAVACVVAWDEAANGKGSILRGYVKQGLRYLVTHSFDEDVQYDFYANLNEAVGLQRTAFIVLDCKLVAERLRGLLTKVLEDR